MSRTETRMFVAERQRFVRPLFAEKQNELLPLHGEAACKHKLVVSEWSKQKSEYILPALCLIKQYNFLPQNIVRRIFKHGARIWIYPCMNMNANRNWLRTNVAQMFLINGLLMKISRSFRKTLWWCTHTIVFQPKDFCSWKKIKLFIYF